MRQNSKLAELTLAELQKKKKTIKSAIIGLGIVILMAVATLIYFTIKNQNYAFLGVAFGSLISLLPSVIFLSQIEAEIKSRNS
jgi:hypothetical protein